jgi:hypothetical protein
VGRSGDERDLLVPNKDEVQAGGVHLEEFSQMGCIEFF